MRALHELERIAELAHAKSDLPQALRNELSAAVAALVERVDALESAADLPAAACCARPTYLFTIERDPATGLIVSIIARPSE